MQNIFHTGMAWCKHSGAAVSSTQSFWLQVVSHNLYRTLPHMLICRDKKVTSAENISLCCSEMAAMESKLTDLSEILDQLQMPTTPIDVCFNCSVCLWYLPVCLFLRLWRICVIWDALFWHRLERSLRCSKVNCQSYNVTSSVWRVFAHNSTKKSCRNTEIDRKAVRSVPVRRSKDQRSRSPGRLMPWPKTSHIFGTGRHRNFKLDTGAYGWRPDMHGDLKGQRSIL